MLGIWWQPAGAQPIGAVERFPAVLAPRLERGLGFAVDARNRWELEMAAQAGATEVRFQPSWESVESYGGVLALSTRDETALAWCAELGLEPLLVAAYGGPRQTILTVTVAAEIPAGATMIPVVEPVGAIDAPFCHVLRENNQQIVREGKWTYYGALIDGVDETAGTLTLAARTSVDLAAGDRLKINRLRYASCATTDPVEPSIAAYGRYTAYLAERVAAHGLRGRIELWNEPPWIHDLWDTRYRLYDSPPPGLETPAVNFGFARLLMASTPPDGVRYNWAGPHKSGFNSLLGSRMSPHPTADQVAASVSSESFHPYGNTPEFHGWDPICIASFPGTSGIEAACALPGSNRSSNMKTAWKYALLNRETYGYAVDQNITEIGWASANQVGKARASVRAFLIYEALGAERVTFYRLADGTAGGYSFVDPPSHAPLVAYTAIQGLLGDAALLPAAALPFSDGDLPQVVAYDGGYPLAVVPIVGRGGEADTANSVFLIAWQRTYPADSSSWIDMASPAEAAVTVAVPAGLRAVDAWNLTTRQFVTITPADDQVSYSVPDDPILVRLIP